MPFIEGGSMRSLLNERYRDGIHDEVLLASILKMLLEGLVYLHSLSIVHRDIKCSNMLVHGDGQVMLSDFGVSDTIKQGKKKYKFVGSPCWMAPEVVDQSVGYDQGVDMWSLGVTAIELSEGNPPFYDQPSMKVLLQILNQEPPSLSKYGNYSDDFVYFVHDCLKKNPLERLRSDQALEKHKKFFAKAKGRDYVY